MLKKIRKFKTFLLLISILLTSLCLCAHESHPVPLDSSNLVTFSAVKGKKWVEKCIKQYPEILWLADDCVRKTEEGKVTLQETYSQQLFGKKFIEFDRTVMTLYCLKLILDGSEMAYNIFTAAQQETMRLSRESFQMLHLQGKQLLKSRWQGMTEMEIVQAMEIALVLSDIGKSKRARILFEPYEVKAPDHDDFYRQALQIMAQHPFLCPSFAKLSDSAKKLLLKTAHLAHYGHITHLEGGLEMLQVLKKSAISLHDPIALIFDLFIHRCDVAGALGHINHQSSLSYTEFTHQAIQAMANAIKIFADPNKSELDVYNAYLSIRASWLGLDPNIRSDRVLTRIGAMLRLFTQKEGEVLKKAMDAIEKSMRARIADQLDVSLDESFNSTPTYIPAVLVNLSKNPELGKMKEERLFKAITIGLPFIVRVLEAYKERVVKGEMNANIPLNFNKIAGIAKSFPNSLQGRFVIDREGNVNLGAV